MSRVKVITCVLLLLVCAGIGLKCHSDQQTLDAVELHYDADDWFIIADANTGLVGIYKGVKPVHYFYCDELLESNLDKIPYLVYGKGRDNE